MFQIINRYRENNRRKRKPTRIALLVELLDICKKNSKTKTRIKVQEFVYK